MVTLRLALKGCGKEAETEWEEEQSSDMLSWQEGRDKGQCILQAGQRKVSGGTKDGVGQASHPSARARRCEMSRINRTAWGGR